MPIVVWPMPDIDHQQFNFFDGARELSCVVFEDDDPDMFKSKILGPDGEPILYDYIPDRQHFIGFVDPAEIEAIREAQQNKRRRRRRANTRKSKA